MARNRFEDIYAQRAILTILHNVADNAQNPIKLQPYASKLDNMLLRVYDINSYDLIIFSEKSFLIWSLASLDMNNPDGTKAFPRLESAVREGLPYPQQKTSFLTLMASTAMIGGFASLCSLYYIRHIRKQRTLPLDLFQLRWLRYQCVKTPLLAMILYVFQESLFQVSDHLSNNVLTFTTEKDNTNIPIIASLYFLNLPILFFSIKFAYNVIFPTFLPFRIRMDSPPLYIKVLPYIRYYAKYFGFEMDDYPTENEINTITTPPLSDDEAIKQYMEMNKYLTPYKDIY